VLKRRAHWCGGGSRERRGRHTQTEPERDDNGGGGGGDVLYNIMRVCVRVSDYTSCCAGHTSTRKRQTLSDRCRKEEGHCARKDHRLRGPTEKTIFRAPVRVRCIGFTFGGGQSRVRGLHVGTRPSPTISHVDSHHVVRDQDR